MLAIQRNESQRITTAQTSVAENKPSASIQGVHKGSEKKQAKMERRVEIRHEDRILRHDRPQMIR
jgi:hypothetical protein